MHNLSFFIRQVKRMFKYRYNILLYILLFWYISRSYATQGYVNMEQYEHTTETTRMVNSSTVLENVSYDSRKNESNEIIFGSKGKFNQTEWLINTCVVPLLILFGTIGNGLTFIIMRRGALKKFLPVFTCQYSHWLILVSYRYTTCTSNLNNEIFNYFHTTRPVT